MNCRVRALGVLAGIAITLGVSGAGHAQTAPAPAAAQRFEAAAEAALAHGRLDEAEALAHERPAGDPAALALRARILIARGDYAGAAALLAPEGAPPPRGAAALTYARLLVRTGRRTDAEGHFSALLAAGARSLDSYELYRAGTAARALRRYHDANELLRRAVEASPSDPALHTAWADLYRVTYDYEYASRYFQEALSLDDAWAPAHLGLARVLADENLPQALAAAERALEIHPDYVDAMVFLADQALQDGSPTQAGEWVDRALAVNPASLAARARRAARAYLADRSSDFEAEVDAVLELNPTYGEIYRVAGQHTARAYRFDEAVALARRAVALDPDNIQAYADLGLHLLRTGDEPAARVALERAFSADPFNVVTKNLLDLLDRLDSFVTVERGDVILRMHPDELPVLSEYVLQLSQQALDELSARYEVTVAGPILIEVFPRHDDFAVRTLGLPGMIGALGACFGRVVTMDSPRARPPGDFNWRATLWHEIAHVITLQMSNQRIPRWLSEGISSYEEQLARPEWGRDQALGFAQAINTGRVLPLTDLNDGFSRPDTIGMAYFQAAIVVEHLVERYGVSALHTLVRAYADGVDTEQALARIGLDFETLQRSFDAAVEEQFGDLRRALRTLDAEDPAAAPATGLEQLERLAAEHPDHYGVQLALGTALQEAGRLGDALVPLERAALLAPQATGMESPRGRLAVIAQALDDPERAMRELERLLEVDATSVEAVRTLGALAEAAGDEERRVFAAERLIGIDPFDSAPHRTVGRAALEAGEFARAVVEFEVALATSPVDQVSAHCDLAEAYQAAGRLADAKREALRALELAPTYARAQELLLAAVRVRP